MKMICLLVLGMIFIFSFSSFAWAEDDLTARPVPTSTFLSDHSYDNDDVDGTTLKGAPANDDIGAPPKTAKDTEALEVLDQIQMSSGENKKSEVRNIEVKAPEAKPTPVDTPSAIPAGF